MLAQFVKLIAALFFAYISIDSFYKMRKTRLEIEDEILNPKTGRILRMRALRTGILFMIMAILSFATLWLRVAPLGE